MEDTVSPQSVSYRYEGNQLKRIAIQNKNNQVCKKQSNLINDSEPNNKSTLRNQSNMDN